MADERDLLAAIAAIAEADTGAGGLVPLHGGKAHPVVEWADEGMRHRPVTAVEIQVTDRGTGSSGIWKGTIRLNVFVPTGAGRLDSTIVTRYEAVLTTPALMTHGIDGWFEWGGRPDLTGLEKRGSGRRRALVGKFTFKH